MIDISDECERSGTMCTSFYFSGMPSMSKLHMCVDLILDPSGILILIGLSAGCKLFTVVPGRKKWPLAPASAI